MALISDRDIFNIVAYDYLDIKDLINLDTAVVNDEERAGFLDLLRTVPYRPPYHDMLEKWWRHHKALWKWLTSRQMFNPEGFAWHTNKKMWSYLYENNDVDYKPMLGKLKEVFFEGFGGPFNLQGLQVCDSLESLQLCNYNDPLPAEPLPQLPSLHTLILQNTKINDITLRNFMGARNLKFLNFRHVNFDAVSDEVAQYYMKQLQQIKVLNKVPEFFQRYCKFENTIEIAAFDMLHQTKQTEFDLAPFLSKSPCLRELHIERMCVDIQTVYSLIARHCPNLEYLHLNHIRVAAPGSSAGQIVDFSEVPFSRLKISTMIPATDDNYEKALGLTRGKIQHLWLSYCERLTDGGYLKIRDLCPYLQKLEIDDKRELFEGEPERVGRVERVADYFKAVPNVRITLWPHWLSEFQKVKYAVKGTLVHHVGN